MKRMAQTAAARDPGVTLRGRQSGAGQGADAGPAAGSDRLLAQKAGENNRVPGGPWRYVGRRAKLLADENAERRYTGTPPGRRHGPGGRPAGQAIARWSRPAPGCRQLTANGRASHRAEARKLLSHSPAPPATTNRDDLSRGSKRQRLIPHIPHASGPDARQHRQFSAMAVLPIEPLSCDPIGGSAAICRPGGDGGELRLPLPDARP